MEHRDINQGLGRIQVIALVVGVLGAVAAGFGFMTDRETFFQSWLMAFFYWFAIAGGSLLVLIIHHLVAARWGFAIQRVLEAGAKTLPLFAILFIPIAFGVHSLYEWARPEALHDEILQKKTLYLNVPFFLVRAAGYFVIWSALAFAFSRLSNRQDQESDPTATNEKIRMLSGPAIVIYIMTVTFAAIDWGMSLEPHWFSTMYGPMILAGQLLSTFSFAAIVANRLRKQEPLDGVMVPQYFHDIGNFIFASTILYTYMSIGEYIIIWSGNLAEETEWYMHRAGEWHWVALALALGVFVIPFLVLLNKPMKRNGHILAKVALWVLAARGVGVLWMVGPTFRHRPELHWLDGAAWLAVGGLFVAAFFGFLRSKPLLPTGDPRYKAKFTAGHQPAAH